MSIIGRSLFQLSVAILGFGLFAGSLSAQGIETCTLSAGIPSIVRATGMAELLGDLIINCTGGLPTPAGEPIPAENFQLALSANSNGRSFPISLNLTEALMMIDEPFPANPVPSWAPRRPGAPPQIVCTAFSMSCPEVGTGGSQSPYQTQPNVFVGMQNGANAIGFNGIPFDAPGTTETRVIRITNIRANASELGVSSGLIPTAINVLISINGNAIVLLNQPPGGSVVGIIETDLLTSVTTVPALSQCRPHNASLLGGSGTARFDFSIQTQEGFAADFKFRNYGTVAYGNEFPQQLSEQNVPGFNYATESGFYSPTLFTSIPNIGLADFGTRILVQFQNVSAGTHLFVPLGIVTKDFYCAPSTNCPVGGYLRLVKSGQAGGSPPGYSPVPVAGMVKTDKVGEVTYSGTTAYATYEVTNSDPSALEVATIPVAVAFDSSPAPAAGLTETRISFAPISSASTASPTAPLPRFGNPFPLVATYTISACTAAP
jgi:hypothetical protein